MTSLNKSIDSIGENTKRKVYQASKHSSANDDNQKVKRENGLKFRYATRYGRLPTREVAIGNIILGGNHDICLQSMTTSATEDIEAVVQEALRIHEAGAAMVRITTQNAKAVDALSKIKSRLRQLGCEVPLVADVHFTPNAAMLAAEIVEKVRINPGNFVDKKRLVLKKYTEKAFSEAKEKIAEKFFPLLEVCKKNNTALRIGVNHGSLSDRLVHSFGDSPLGMVESAYEYLELAKQQNFHRLIFSMKSSNPIVMVHAYRMMALRMEEREEICYPFHLGVTEAGDEAQGRVKSVTGIASLLFDGIGDTVRVSLTEPAENELPVASSIVNNVMRMVRSDDYLFPPSTPTETEVCTKKNAKSFGNKINETLIKVDERPHSEENGNFLPSFPVTFKKRKTISTKHFGGNKTPKVYASLESESVGNISLEEYYKLFAAMGHNFHVTTDKWHSSDVCIDGVLLMKPSIGEEKSELQLKKELPSTVSLGKEEGVCASWLLQQTESSENNGSKIEVTVGLKNFPALFDAFCSEQQQEIDLKKNWILSITYEEAAALSSSSSLVSMAKKMEGCLSLLFNFNANSLFVQRVRNAVLRLHCMGVRLPILLEVSEKNSEEMNKQEKLEVSVEKKLVSLATRTAPLFVDGLLDGLVLHFPINRLELATGFRTAAEDLNTLFLMLQAARQRIAKPEYISCPSCGRTLFNLQTVTAKIKARTSHLKGVKIGIMGCIVNGPGEMADAHFGYVGAGAGLITLYKGQTVVQRNIPEDRAVDELVLLIKKHGMWRNS